jgi:type I restriction enzyme R subunit
LDALSSLEEELSELRANRQAIMDLLAQNGLTDLSDHDAFFDVLYDEDLRFELVRLFKWFTKSLNVVFPDKEALDYMHDYQALAEINVLAGRHFRDSRLSISSLFKNESYK